MTEKTSVNNSNHILIRERVLKALTQYEKFWLIFKENTFGIAGLLDLKYKRSYIEVLFNLPNQKEPLLEISSPLVNELNFDPILEDPPLLAEGFVDPKQTIKKILEIANNTVHAYNYILQNEIRKLNEVYENYPIGGNQFHRQVFVYLHGKSYVINVDFSKYPRRPHFNFGDSLVSILPEADFMKNSVLKDWDELNPSNIGYILHILIQVISKKLKKPEFTEDSQQIIFENVQTSPEFNEYSFQLHRGQSLGVIVNTSKSELQIHDFMLGIFRTITGMHKPLRGRISIFNSQNPLEFCTIVSQTIDQGLESYQIRKAIDLNIRLHDSLAGLKNKDVIQKVLTAIGLKNKRKSKLSSLTPGEIFRFNIGRAILQAPELVLLFINKDMLNQFETAQFFRYLDNLKREFHTIFIMSGQRDIISQCEKVLTLSDASSSTGFVDELVRQIPQAGEVITLELNNAPQELLESMVNIENAIFIEERKNEKYKIYSEENPDELILKILHFVGPFLYTFKRKKPKLEDYLQFKAIKDE